MPNTTPYRPFDPVDPRNLWAGTGAPMKFLAGLGGAAGLLTATPQMFDKKKTWRDRLTTLAARGALGAGLGAGAGLGLGAGSNYLQVAGMRDRMADRAIQDLFKAKFPEGVDSAALLRAEDREHADRLLDSSLWQRTLGSNPTEKRLGNMSDYEYARRWKDYYRDIARRNVGDLQSEGRLPTQAEVEQMYSDILAHGDIDGNLERINAITR